MAYHIMKLMKLVMNALERHSNRGFFIVVYECRIHHSAFVVDTINKTGQHEP